jgi:sugar/nucleoside kinase (ribokinase family)
MPLSLGTGENNLMGSESTGAAGQPAGFDISVVGVYFCDLIFTGLPRMPVLGHEVFGTGFDLLPGGTFNIVLAMHRLGLKVAWHCEFGNDFVSRFVLDAARQAGIDDRYFTIHDHPHRNLTVSLSFAEDRAFVTYADQFTPGSVASLIDDEPVRCVVLPVIYNRPDLIALSKAVHSQGGLIFMDCAQHEVTLETPGMLDTLQAVDVFTANETEILQLTGTESVDDAMAMLAPHTKLVVIKLGEKGSVARRGDDVIRVPALPDAEIVDTTGAGDCFNAGFLYGYLGGMPIKRCLQLGNIVGGLSTRARGTQAVPTLEEVEPLLDKHYSSRS